MKQREAILGGLIFVFVAQAVSSRVLHRDPYLPAPPPLANMPLLLGNWQSIADNDVSADALAVLGPDDYLARQYQMRGEQDQAELFVAYYKTQLQTKNAHDPKVCLPGAGWNPVDSHLATVTEPGSGLSFPVNYYRIKKGDTEEVVLYWFQTLKGVYTFEQQLRAHRIVDAILDNRTDMALVRIIVPVTSAGVSQANDRAMAFAQSAYKSMLPYFPPTERSGS